MTYVPSSMPAPDDDLVLSLIEELHFATVVSQGPGGLSVSHVPCDIRCASRRLKDLSVRFHFAARNSHAAALADSPEVVLIFRGADGYVSPKWYDHENVPTWDYAAVHMRGAVGSIPLEDIGEHLFELVDQMEPGLQVREEFASAYFGDVRGFILQNPSVEPVFKLSQDKSRASVDGVCEGLRQRKHPLDESLAVLIEKAYRQ